MSDRPSRPVTKKRSGLRTPRSRSREIRAQTRIALTEEYRQVNLIPVQKFLSFLGTFRRFSETRVHHDFRASHSPSGATAGRKNSQRPPAQRVAMKSAGGYGRLGYLSQVGLQKGR
jgi:hypothetical protein